METHGNSAAVGGVACDPNAQCSQIGANALECSGLGLTLLPCSIPDGVTSLYAKSCIFNSCLFDFKEIVAN